MNHPILCGVCGLPIHDCKCPVPIEYEDGDEYADEYEDGDEYADEDEDEDEDNSFLDSLIDGLNWLGRK